MSCGGNAAKPSRTFGSKGLGEAENREIEIKTGNIAGYNMGAGSKDAGMRMRCLNRRFDGDLLHHE